MGGPHLLMSIQKFSNLCLSDVVFLCYCKVKVDNASAAVSTVKDAVAAMVGTVALITIKDEGDEFDAESRQ